MKFNVVCKNETGAIILRYTIQTILFLIGAIVVSLCVFGLPSIANEMAVQNPNLAYLQWPMLFGLWATAIPFIYALYSTAQIVKNAGDFEAMSYYLRHIQHCAAVILGLYLAGLFMLIEANAGNPAVGLFGIIVIMICLLIATVCFYFRYEWKKRGFTT